MERLSLFIISIVVCSIIVLGLGMFYTGVSTEYGVVNNQNLTGYDQMAGIQDVTGQLNASINSQPTSTGGFAVIGDFLSYGYNTMKIAILSYDYFYVMMNHGAASISAGDATTGNIVGLILAAVGTIVFILIAFSIISILTGRGEL